MDAHKPPPEGGTRERESDPGAGGEAALSGDMGVSSERVAPDPDGADGAGAGWTGQGTRGTALGHINGEQDVSPAEWDAEDVSVSELYPDRDGALDQPAGTSPASGVDRTVGEPRPEPIEGEKLRRR